METPVILSAVRSPIGKFQGGGRSSQRARTGRKKWWQASCRAGRQADR
jgi:hypothetical protein